MYTDDLNIKCVSSLHLVCESLRLHFYFNLSHLPEHGVLFQYRIYCLVLHPLSAYNQSEIESNPHALKMRFQQ